MPPSELLNVALRDPCFYEFFVLNGRGYITENILKDLFIVNGLAVKYHSIKFSDGQQTLLQQRLRRCYPGDVIFMEETPLAINVEIIVPDDMPNHIIAALKSFSITRPHANSSNIVIPLQPNATPHWDDRDTVVAGSEFFGPSKILLGSHFPVELAFASTCHKSEGRTMDRSILALSRCGVTKCNWSYEQVNVGFSRVREGQHIRLLLVGSDEEDQWQSVVYLTSLRQDLSIKFYFAGFRDISTLEDPNQGWETDAWNPQRANRKFLQLVQDGAL